MESFILLCLLFKYISTNYWPLLNRNLICRQPYSFGKKLEGLEIHIHLFLNWLRYIFCESSQTASVTVTIFIWEHYSGHQVSNGKPKQLFLSDSYLWGWGWKGVTKRSSTWSGWTMVSTELLRRKHVFRSAKSAHLAASLGLALAATIILWKRALWSHLLLSFCLQFSWSQVVLQKHKNTEVGGSFRPRKWLCVTTVTAAVCSHVGITFPGCSGASTCNMLSGTVSAPTDVHLA